jgi:hypothetical protein
MVQIIVEEFPFVQETQQRLPHSINVVPNVTPMEDVEFLEAILRQYTDPSMLLMKYMEARPDEGCRILRGNIVSSYSSINVVNRRYGGPDEGCRRAFIRYVSGLYPRVHDVVVCAKVIGIKS